MTIREFIHKLTAPKCKHDFVVKCNLVNDRSFGGLAISTSYWAYCRKCGAHHRRYVYAADISAEQLKEILDVGGEPPGFDQPV